jgi:hypothetical protein
LPMGQPGQSEQLEPTSPPPYKPACPQLNNLSEGQQWVTGMCTGCHHFVILHVNKFGTCYQNALQVPYLILLK